MKVIVLFIFVLLYGCCTNNDTQIETKNNCNLIKRIEKLEKIEYQKHCSHFPIFKEKYDDLIGDTIYYKECVRCGLRLEYYRTDERAYIKKKIEFLNKKLNKITN